MNHVASQSGLVHALRTEGTSEAVIQNLAASFLPPFVDKTSSEVSWDSVAVAFTSLTETIEGEKGLCGL